MRRIGEHAVVIGGSMAGLLAARALMDAFERVTVLDRDTLPHGFGGRRAVPQGRHAHGLLPHGLACLDALLPGFGAELVADGAVECEALAETRFVIGGHQLARASTGVYSLLASRPFIEGHVRRRVRALPGVELVDGCDALGLIADRGGERVAGVRTLRRADGSAEESLAADLVVVANGRAARLPAWLEGLGYARPREEQLRIGVTYASRHLRLPAGALGGDKLVLIGARPGHPRTLFLFAQEHGRWILSVGGYGAEHRPPSDPAEFAAFAATVAPPDVIDAIAAAEPLDDVVTHGFPASIRRRYERLRRFPAGLLACGDAICSFNPTYGQGMTVAAAEAVALRGCLERGERDLAPRLFRAATAPVDHAWQLSVGGDLALPEVEGRRPVRVRLINAYLRRLRARAEHDPAVAGALAAVIGMREPPAHVLRPAVLTRVLRGPAPVGWSERAAAVRRSELRVGDVRTPLRAAGPSDAREAVVFLHGNPGSGADWEPLLAAVGEHRRAVAWDAPGFGAAAAPEFPQTVEAHAAFVGRALDALGIERAHVVAHDFGGPWGLEWAASDPERFASAVLIGTGALPGYRWHALARLWRTPIAGELFMATTTRPGFRLLLRRGQRRALPARVRRSHVRRLRSRDPQGRAAALPLRARRRRGGRAARARAAPARPSGARAVGRSRPVPARRARRAPARGVPACRRARPRGQRPLAVRRRSRGRRRGAEGVPRARRRRRSRGRLRRDGGRPRGIGAARRSASGGGRGRRRAALEPALREHPVEPARQPPAALPQQLHHGRDEHHPHDRRVDEDRAREAEADQLERDVGAQRERPEHGDHDQRGGGDHARGSGEPLGHGAPRVAARQVLLAHAREQEHLVVHRQTEQDREHDHRYERRHRRRAVDAHQLAGPAALGQVGDDAVRGADREQVHRARLEPDHDRAEAEEQQQERQPDDPADEQRQPVGRRLALVHERRGGAAEADRRPGVREHVGAQALDQVLGRRVLRRRRRDHADDDRVARRARRRGGDRGHAGLAAQALRERGHRVAILLVRGRRSQQQRPVRARPEALRDEVVGLARGGVGRVVAAVGEAEPQVGERGREHQQHRDPRDGGDPRAALDGAAPASR